MSIAPTTKDFVAEPPSVELPTMLDNTHQKMLDKLNDLKGEDFAKR